VWSAAESQAKNEEWQLVWATDASLPRSMPVGTYLKKQKWHLYYERNEQRVNDFPIVFYQVTFGIALGCVF
jgi:hypothetical protein